MSIDEDRRKAANVVERTRELPSFSSKAANVVEQQDDGGGGDGGDGSSVRRLGGTLSQKRTRVNLMMTNRNQSQHQQKMVVEMVAWCRHTMEGLTRRRLPGAYELLGDRRRAQSSSQPKPIGYSNVGDGLSTPPHAETLPSEPDRQCRRNGERTCIAMSRATGDC